MARNRGRRYDDEPHLNIKKVVALIIAIIVIVMSVVSITKLLKQGKTEEKFAVVNEYLTIYTNEKWGIINSKGEVIIPANYDEMIIIPDKTKGTFVCTYDVNYDDGTYKTKVLNEKNEEILKDYPQIEAIDNYNEKGETWYDNNVLRYKKNDKYGLVDFSGKNILNADYDNIYSLKGIDRSIIIEKDGKKGIINSVTGEIVINPIYEEIEALGSTYDSGYIVKNEDGKCGIIGPDKRVLLEEKYDEILKVSGNNMYVVKENSGNNIVNGKGEVIVEDAGDVIEINGDHIVIKKDDSYGIIGIDGSEEVPVTYDSLVHAFGDYYIAKASGKTGVISNKNETVVDFNYETINYVKAANILKAEKINYESDIIDSNFTVRITGIISELNTEKGYIRVRKAGEYRYYNFNFEEKSNRDILTGNTLFLVKNNGKYGYQNKAGELVVDYKYDDATEQNRYGFCSVKKDGVWGCLKSDGTVVVEPSKNLTNNLYVDFIGEWYLYENLDLNAYTK